MPESDHTWRKAFKGEPIEAEHVRLWTARRVNHSDAPLIANELYVALLGSGAPVIEMEISTAPASASPLSARTRCPCSTAMAPAGRSSAA